MIIYRRRKGHDLWHWCTNCTTWPVSEYEEIHIEGRPKTGELCDACWAKEKTGCCSKCQYKNSRQTKS